MQPVVVRLLGGMGNQLFQYAMGRKLADERGVDLLLDSRFVTRKGHVSGLAIDLFNNRASFLDEQQSGGFFEWAWRLSRALRRLWRPLFGFYHETSFTFDANVSCSKSGLMLSGFWQSHRYFPPADVLRQDFSLKQPFTALQQSYAARMTGCNSVAVHARRGDYVNDAKALAKHGICSINYYRNAVVEIGKRVGNPTFFVFSDDPVWVKENLPLDNAVFVSDEGFSQEVDLTLIASCKHQIIANSSFSWWGAYLNSYEDKVVILPQPWFDTPELSDKDMSPKSWIRLPK